MILTRLQLLLDDTIMHQAFRMVLHHYFLDPILGKSTIKLLDKISKTVPVESEMPTWDGLAPARSSAETDAEDQIWRSAFPTSESISQTIQLDYSRKPFKPNAFLDSGSSV